MVNQIIKYEMKKGEFSFMYYELNINILFKE
jgi:hypothetical protein